MFNFTTISIHDFKYFLKAMDTLNWAKYPIICSYNTKYLAEMIETAQELCESGVRYFMNDNSHILLFMRNEICFAFIDGEHETVFDAKAVWPGETGLSVKVSKSPLILNYITVDMSLEGFKELYKKSDVITPDDLKQ